MPRARSERRRESRKQIVGAGSGRDDRGRSAAAARRPPRFGGPGALLFLPALGLALFGDVLFSPKQLVLSRVGTDVYNYFTHIRRFGFAQLREGNLPLWNPHVFSGTPFFGNFQSALLYPPNVLYLMLPLDTAINADVLLHVVLVGVWMYLWATRRGLHPAAALVAACVLMLGAPFYLKVYAGHLATLGAMAWIPLVFLAIDLLVEQRFLAGWLLGVLGVTMQILAGHPQTAFYTGVAAVLYIAIRLVEAGAKVRLVLGVVGIFAGAAAIAAVQILTGLHTSAESTRGARGVPYAFAATFSLPPENFVTLIGSTLLGGTQKVQYWGRGYVWEMSLFIGVTGFVLAVYGAIAGPTRLRRPALLMIVLLLWLALGAYTPLFPLLYAYVPGFDRFRGSSKFIVHAAVFMALLCGIGLDRLVRGRPPRWIAPVLLLTAALGLAATALWIRDAATDTASLWGRAMAALATTDDLYVAAPSDYRQPIFVRQAGALAADGVLVAAAACVVLSVVFSLMRIFPKAVYLLAALAIAEVFAFARANRPMFDLAETRPTELERYLAGRPGDYRILNLGEPNSAMDLGGKDIWGYDPVVLGRYAEFMAFTQGEDPDETTMYVEFSKLHRLFDMLRFRFAFVPAEGRTKIEENDNPMPQLQLVHDWQVVTGRDRIFAALSDPSFDPRRKVLLETVPEPPPAHDGGAGTVRLVDSSTDDLTIEADLPDPAILLVTDAYSSGWRAVALPGSVQREYTVLPADYVLRAVPLTAGQHRLRIEYSPRAFRVGTWISLAALVVYALVLGWYWTGRRARAAV